MRKWLNGTFCLFVVVLALTISSPRLQSSPFWSLDQLLTTADTVFWGEAVSVRSVAGPEPGLHVFPTRITIFDVLEGLKGVPKGKTKFVVKEFAPLALPVERKDRVLWFLSSASDVGLRSIIGQQSGYFTIFADPADPARLLAQNLNENRGLWSTDGNLWTNGFDRQATKEYLESRFGLNEKRQEEVLSFGDQPCRPRGVPVELLVAVSHSKLAAKVHPVAPR